MCVYHSYCNVSLVETICLRRSEHHHWGSEHLTAIRAHMHDRKYPLNGFYLLNSDETENNGMCEMQIGLSGWGNHI